MAYDVTHTNRTLDVDPLFLCFLDYPRPLFIHMRVIVANQVLLSHKRSKWRAIRWNQANALIVLTCRDEMK